MITHNTKGDTRRYRGVSYTKPIDEAKRLVPVPDLAEKLSGAPGVKRGRELAYICPLHDDHNPSLRVDPGKGVWFCDPCLLGGDCVELARLVWGYDQCDAHVAAVEILLWFGFDVPQRPPAWFRKQERQKASRDAVEKTRNNIRRRRLFEYLILPHVDAIADEEERNRELDRAWVDFRRLMP
jgi:DNA primase